MKKIDIELAYTIWLEIDNFKSISFEYTRLTANKFKEQELEYAIGKYILYNWKEIKQEILPVLNRKHKKEFNDDLYKLFLISISFYIWNDHEYSNMLLSWFNDNPELILPEYKDKISRYLAYAKGDSGLSDEELCYKYRHVVRHLQA